MPIPLKPDTLFKSTRVYSIDQKNREVINKTFDKLHKQEKIT